MASGSNSGGRSNGRKRTRPSFLLEDSTPSDPALFSSDPPDPSMEHYFSPRKKKQYRGTWWQDGKVERKGRKAFTRNMDSGVFMGSDSSCESADAGPIEDVNSDATVPDDDALDVSQPSKELFVSQNHRPARVSEPAVITRVRKCIAYFAENGGLVNVEAVDEDDDINMWLRNHYRDAPYMQAHLALNGFDMHVLTDDMIKPLFHLVKAPQWRPRLTLGEDRNHGQISELSDSETEYDTLEHRFTLDLCRNGLFKLPHALFGISGIGGLHLTANNLLDLSPHIRLLKDLDHLSVSGNRLRWLPGDILDQMDAVHRENFKLSTRYNPFVQPFSYAGFVDRLADIVDDLHRDSGFGTNVLNLVPATLNGVTNAYNKLRSQSAASSATKPEQRDLQIQEKWLERLYEHLISVPERLWLDLAMIIPLSEHSAIQTLTDEERALIHKRWGCTQDVLGLLTAHDPHIHALINLKRQFGAAISKHSIFMAATSVCYLDESGRPLDNSISLPSELPVDEYILPARLLKVPERPSFINTPGQRLYSYRELEATSRSNPQGKQSHVRSLFSLCLRSAVSIPEYEHLPDLLPDDISRLVRNGVSTAIQSQHENGRTCSTCNRSYIVPRAEWLEYHYIHDLQENRGDIELAFMPFLRRVCSFACVPQFEYDD